MATQLRYGTDSTLRFDFAPGVLLAECAPYGEAIDDIAAAVSEALRQPVDFPPFSRALVPGDRVVLALEPGLPQVADLLEALIRNLAACQIDAADITILHGPGEAEDQRALLPQGPHGPQFLAHDPDSRASLAYLAADMQGEPIYLNRALCDADVVLPIGCSRLASERASSGLYPAFADRRSQQRLASSKRHEGPEPEEINWLLGVQCILQVVPGPGGGLLRVLAGQPNAVLRRTREIYESAWRYTVPRRASLVVAAVEGDASQQTWANVGRALAAATEAVTDDGAIAIVSDLEAEPGPALQHLAEVEDPQRALREIRKTHPPDERVAAQLARARDHARVYFLSRLDESIVEDLGMASVAAQEEIVRLASRHPSCILLSSAQHALVAHDGKE